MKPLSQSLLRQAQALLRDPKVSEILSARCERQLANQNGRVSTDIHPADQMLTHSLRELEDVNQSVSQYFCVALQQYRALHRMRQLAFPQGGYDGLTLDFACGYGRALRFLVHSYPPEQIWASDIQEDAVVFVRDQFGVNSHVSDASPTKFEPGRKFDFIWVASLFTHLPERLFRVWLVRLYELLTDDGYLVFSVHDESILPEGFRLAKNGFLFTPESEIAELDTAVYGTTHVSESFVRSVLVEDLAIAEGGYLRIPRGLADQQDLYVIPKRQQSLARFAAYRQGAWGWVERAIAYGVTLDAPTALVDMSGWAKSLDSDSFVKAVYAEVEGVRYQATLGIRRPDLAKAWASDFEHYGWELRFPIPRGTKSFVSVLVELDTDEVGLVYFGQLDSAHLLALAPWGYLDTTSIKGGALHLSGWSAAYGRKITKVAVKVDDSEYEAVLGDSREDVGNVLGDSGYRYSGWHVDVPMARLRSPVSVRVVAFADDGDKRTLFEGPIQTSPG